MPIIVPLLVAVALFLLVMFAAAIYTLALWIARDQARRTVSAFDPRRPFDPRRAVSPFDPRAVTRQFGEPVRAGRRLRAQALRVRRRVQAAAFIDTDEEP